MTLLQELEKLLAQKATAYRKANSMEAWNDYRRVRARVQRARDAEGKQSNAADVPAPRAARRAGGQKLLPLPRTKQKTLPMRDPPKGWQNQDWTRAPSSSTDPAARARRKQAVVARAQAKVATQQRAARARRAAGSPENYKDKKQAANFTKAQLDAEPTRARRTKWKLTAKARRPEGLITDGDGWDAFEFTAKEAEVLEKRDAQAMREYAAGYRPPCPLTKYEVSKSRSSLSVSAAVQHKGSNEWHNVGTLSAYREGDAFVVGGAFLPFTALSTCPGLGTKLYEAAAEAACAMGGTLAGSAQRSPFSQRFWARQMQKGRAACNDCADDERECAEWSQGDCEKWSEDSECAEYSQPEDDRKIRRLLAASDAAEKAYRVFRNTKGADSTRPVPDTETEKKLLAAYEAAKEAHQEAVDDFEPECQEYEDPECEEYGLGDECLEYEDGDCGSGAQVYDTPTHDLRRALDAGDITVPQYNALRKGLPEHPGDEWECNTVPLKKCSAGQSLRGLKGFRIESPSTKLRYKIVSR